jgi:hypothetical protein
MQFQTELLQALGHGDNVSHGSAAHRSRAGSRRIGVAHDDHVALGVQASPLPGPEIEGIV